MESLKIRITTTQEMLGTTAGNSDIVRDFIASKVKDSKDPNIDKEARAAEEMEVVEKTLAERTEEQLENAMTIFPICNREEPYRLHPMENATPFIWDYQVKGFLKAAVLALCIESGAYTKEQQKKLGLTKYMYKRTVDNLWFPFPRRIILDMPGPLTVIQRPLRAETMRGERICLAISEAAPIGTTFECEIKYMNPVHHDIIRDCLDYGELKGLLQWRNAGFGRFTWEQIE